MSKKIPLSIAIIAKDEADRLARCLDSLGFADEVVVVVDDRSHDETAAIAREKGCQVHESPWGGFALQKQRAVDLTRNDWVLILDADEVVPRQTASALEQVMASGSSDISAYSLHRRNFFHGRWIRRCGWWPDRIVRLVNKQKGRFSDHQVHEHWAVKEGETLQLDLVIDHHSFRNYADLISKLQHYSTLSSRQL